jgi:hypothetical protein
VLGCHCQKWCHLHSCQELQCLQKNAHACQTGEPTLTSLFPLIVAYLAEYVLTRGVLHMERARMQKGAHRQHCYCNRYANLNQSPKLEAQRNTDRAHMTYFAEQAAAVECRLPVAGKLAG